MIGRITGTLVIKQAPSLLVDVNGVGYELDASMQTFYHLPDIGHTLTLHTHFVVREDAQQLYGFVKELERSLFRQLIKISGVGPKLALAILSGMTPEEFIRCVNQGDTATLVRLPGVGKKTAERLLIEIKDKLKQLPVPSAIQDEIGMPATGQAALNGHNTGEAQSALVALGYKPAIAEKVVAKAGQELAGEPSVEDLIRQALKHV